MMQSYLKIHSQHLALSNMSPPALMLRAIWPDLIFMEEADKQIKLISCQVGPFLLDHKLVSAVLNIKKTPIENRRHYQYVHLNALLRKALKQPLMKMPLTWPSHVDTVLHQLNAMNCIKHWIPLHHWRRFKLLSTRDNLGSMRLAGLGIKWCEIGSGFDINILNLIFGRPIKWRGIYTTDFTFIRKSSL